MWTRDLSLIIGASATICGLKSSQMFVVQQLLTQISDGLGLGVSSQISLGIGKVHRVSRVAIGIPFLHEQNPKGPI